MSIMELEQLAETSDFAPFCPVKETELALVQPVPAGENDVPAEYPNPRWWQYRVC